MDDGGEGAWCSLELEDDRLLLLPLLLGVLRKDLVEANEGGSLLLLLLLLLIVLLLLLLGWLPLMRCS